MTDREQLKEIQKDLLKNINPKKGEVWIADLGETIGSVQGKVRPVVIVSNDIGNANSTIVSVVPITTKTKNSLPTHFDLINYHGLEPSTVLCEQVNTICKSKLIKKKCDTTNYLTSKVSQKLLHALGIRAEIRNNNSYQIKESRDKQ